MLLKHLIPILNLISDDSAHGTIVMLPPEPQESVGLEPGRYFLLLRIIFVWLFYYLTLIYVYRLQNGRLKTPVHKQEKNRKNPQKTLVLRKIIVYYLNETLLEMLQLCNPTAERNWKAHCSETKWA